MNRIFFIITCLFSLLHENVLAQDPHFSQFFTSPLTLSPAFTGKFNGNFRATSNYRNQWPTINKAFTTKTVSVDFHILPKKIADNDTWGLGVMAYNDNNADGAINLNYLSLSTAYHKGLDEEGFQQIGIGMQLTYANMMINTANLQFEDQITTNGFTNVTNEIFNGATLNNNYYDLNAGFLYTGSTNDFNSYYAGVSLYHTNKPTQQFNGALFELNTRTNIHMGGSFPINLNNTIKLNYSGIYTFQGGASETVIGGALEFNFGNTEEDAISLYTGSWLRLNDAIIPYVGLEYNGFRLGASYDVNTSAFKTVSQGLGGVEISLVYINKNSQQRSLPCPKF